MITVTLDAKFVANMCEVTKAFVRYAHLRAKRRELFFVSGCQVLRASVK
jgi:hypothetical protein